MSQLSGVRVFYKNLKNSRGEIYLTPQLVLINHVIYGIINTWKIFKRVKKKPINTHLYPLLSNSSFTTIHFYFLCNLSRKSVRTLSTSWIFLKSRSFLSTPLVELYWICCYCWCAGVYEFSKFVVTFFKIIRNIMFLISC